MRNIVLILLVVVVIFGGGAFFLSQNSTQEMTSQSASPTPDSAMMTIYPSGTPTSDTGAVGQYVPHTKNALNNVNGRRVVLFFYANWCPTCKPVDEVLTKSLSKLPEDVVVIRVNYNDSETDQDEKDLAKKYGITYQHTFVLIDVDGNEVRKWNGGSLEELLVNIK